jgi:hypothetical protein
LIIPIATFRSIFKNHQPNSTLHFFSVNVIVKGWPTQFSGAFPLGFSKVKPGGLNFQGWIDPGANLLLVVVCVAWGYWWGETLPG